MPLISVDTVYTTCITFLLLPCISLHHTCTLSLLSNAKYMITSHLPPHPNFSRSIFVLPDITPAATVEVMGAFLLLTRARKEKSRPSRAMAKMIRGRGNMEPNRLGVTRGRENQIRG